MVWGYHLAQICQRKLLNKSHFGNKAYTKRCLLAYTLYIGLGGLYRLGKWLNADPKVFILDEPTRGIDIGAKVEIYKLLNSLVERGVTVIMISSELPEILGMCDRILVMCEGRVATDVTRETATKEAIMSHATGSA